MDLVTLCTYVTVFAVRGDVALWSTVDSRRREETHAPGPQLWTTAR